MPKDIRSQQRRHLVYYLQVVDPETGAKIGRLVDITTSGMMIITEQPLETGKTIHLRLLISAEFEAKDHLDMVAETIWCHNNFTPDHFAVGLKFLNPSKDTVFAITDLIDSFGFRD